MSTRTNETALWALQLMTLKNGKKKKKKWRKKTKKKWRRKKKEKWRKKKKKKQRKCRKTSTSASMTVRTMKTVEVGEN